MFAVILDSNESIFQNCVPNIVEIVEVIHFRSNELSQITYANESIQHMQHMNLTDIKWRPLLDEVN
jgi:hypothetical protein